MTEGLMARAGQADHSPCVGHCTYDAKDLCLSCRRHSDEITDWRDADDAMRIAAWARIPAEIDAAGLDVMRLPMSPDDIAELAIRRLDEGGSWAVGMKDAWVYAHDLTADEDGVLTAQDEEGKASLTLDLSGKMRAVAWARTALTGRKLADGVDSLPILIAVPKARIKDAPMTSETVLDDGRVDLGYGIPSLRVIKDGDALVMEAMIATARIEEGSALPQGNDPVPEGLNLPDSYVLAAVIMPKGEAAL